MRDQADLHTHTNASDGAFAPREIVHRAVTAGLAALAIADHDTLAGWQAVRACAQEGNIQLVPAVEINAETGDQEVHILGYCFCQVDQLEESLERLRAARWQRAESMVAKLQAIGVRISWSRLVEVSGEAAPGRLHLARVLVESGEATGIGQAFSKYLLPGRPAYTPRHRLTPDQAIALLRQAGGVAILAHPGIGVSDCLVEQLVKQGIQGLEVYHPAHGPDDVIHYLRMAERYGLITTGGSDYHGFEERSGAAIGSCTVPVETVERLYELAQSQ